MFQTKVGMLLTPFIFLILGGGSALGFEPFNLPEVHIVFLLIFLQFAWGRKKVETIFFCWMFGLGQNLVGFNWLMEMLENFSSLDFLESVILYVVICMEVSIFTAIFGFFYFKLSTSRFRAISIASAWVLCEWSKTKLFGWGWNLEGYIWVDRMFINQIADIGGVYLLSWVTIFTAILFLTSFNSKVPRFVLKKQIPWLSTIVLVLGYNCWVHLASLSFEKDVIPELAVGMVQPNIPQYDKWNPTMKDAIFEKYLKLTAKLPSSVDMVIWPESALPIYFQDEPSKVEDIFEKLQNKQADLFIGSDRYEIIGAKKSYYNSVYKLSNNGIQQTYDKNHLIAFGEYLPFRNLLGDWFTQFSPLQKDMTAGVNRNFLTHKNLNIASLICFEAIFAEEVAEFADNGADLLISYANDAWFGEAIKGQHLAMNRMRAIENRRPLIRSSNTGFSAVFSSYGDVLYHSKANEEDVAVISVPIGSAFSFYSFSHSYWIYFFLLTLAMGLFPSYVKRNRKWV